MSCLTPIRIFNKSTFLNESASAAFLDVPCNRCPQCVDAKTLEYKMRAYYEWQDTLNKGGFAYMETFTYNEESLKTRHFHGIRCFNHSDIRNLMHKLRNRCKDEFKFRYFLSAEYGGLYKRPHYHAIFYIIPLKKGYQDRQLYQFRKHVYDSWKEPVLDKNGNAVYKTNSFGVRRPVMRSLGFIDKLSSLLSRKITRIDGMNYVAKYVVKEDDFVSEIDSKFRTLTQELDENSSEYEALKEEKRLAMPFHRQSQGFGNSIEPWLQSIKNDLLQEPCITNLIISNVKIPLPIYYIRKLFYRLQPTGLYDPVTGKAKMKWIPTKLGYEFEKIQKQKQIVRYENKYYDALQNFFIYLEEGSKKYEEVFKLLSSRKLGDFVIYKLIYQGHLHNNYAFKTDASSWMDFFLESKKVGDLENYSYDDNPESKNYFRKYLSDNCINDRINPIWHNFDAIDSIFNEYFTAKSQFILADRKYISDVKHKLKILHKL